MQSPLKQFNYYFPSSPIDHPYRSLRLTPHSNEQLIQFQLSERQSDISNIEPKSWCRTDIQKSQQKMYENSSQFQTDFSYNLGELQQKLAQQMLCLREDKLTLMEQYNNVTHIRQKTERELKRLKRKVESQRDIKQNSPVPSEKANSNTKDQITESEQTPDEQHQLFEKIKYFKSISQYVQDSIREREKERLLTEQSHRQGRNIESMVMQLRNKKRRLISFLLSQQKYRQLENYLFRIMESNHQLQVVIDLFLYQKKNKVQVLQQQVQKDEQEKRQLLEELVKIKAESRLLKNQNEQMKRAFSYFNL